MNTKTIGIVVVLIVIITTSYIIGYKKSAYAPDILDTSARISYIGRDAENMIVIDSPRPEQVISSPLIITGKARGQWAFEADFPITLTDWDGLIIAEGHATLQGDWMTTDFVPFKATLEYVTPQDIGDFSDYGSLILHKSNASGLPEHDASAEMRIKFR